MLSSIISTLRAIGWIFSRLLRICLVVALLAVIAFTGFVAVKGSQPMGVVGIDPAGQTAHLGELSYWGFMANRLAASRATPVNCHHTRLIYLAIGLPLYPALYTYVAMYPESNLASNVQLNPLLPEPITLRQAPDTWWSLVKEISWLAFTQPQWDYTPGVGDRVMVDNRCKLS